MSKAIALTRAVAHRGEELVRLAIVLGSAAALILAGRSLPL